MNRADVQQALHIVNSPIAWGECNDAIFENWPVNDMFGDTIGLYADLYSKLETNTSVAAATDSSLYPNFKLLVFSGDADGVRWYACMRDHDPFTFIIVLCLYDRCVQL